MEEVRQIAVAETDHHRRYHAASDPASVVGPAHMGARQPLRRLLYWYQYRWPWSVDHGTQRSQAEATSWYPAHCPLGHIGVCGLRLAPRHQQW